jgi:ribulose 1,5-bisphosphate synthetase/thiazole synthase
VAGPTAGAFRVDAVVELAAGERLSPPATEAAAGAARLGPVFGAAACGGPLG